VSRNAISLRIGIGDPIPSIGLRATDGFLLNLRSWVGKSPVALVFFTGPSLGGAARIEANALAQALAAAVPRLQEAGLAVAGITTDNERQQSAYVADLELPYLLLSDERQIAVQALGVPTVAKRGTTNVSRPVLLTIDETGLIRGVYVDPDPRLLAALAIAFREPLPA
jgi:peroxiredoxin